MITIGKTTFIGLMLILLNQAFCQDESIIISGKLEKAWETDKIFKVPESVCYDPENKILYISNINGNPSAKDGNGFISMMSLEGEVLDLEWVKGLDAPKGMGVQNGYLYVTDIDKLVKISISEGKILQKYPAVNAKFLNDIAIGKKDYVYVTDMQNTTIYRYKDGEFFVWMDDEILTSPNGLYIDDDFLFVGCKKIIKINTDDKSWEIIAGGTGGIDGLERLPDGNFVFSDWQGHVYLSDNEGTITEILDTTPAGINAADIEFIPEQSLLLIPTFFDNRIMAYKLTQ